MLLISPIIKRDFSFLPSSLYLPILFGEMKGVLWIPKSANPGQVIGRYEPQHEKILITLLNSSKVFWDVGAHVGWYSLLASKKIRKGAVYSFEPNPDNISYIKKHISINDIDNIKIVPYAMSSSSGTSYFSGQKQQGHLSDTGHFQVETMTADEFIKNENIVPDLIKIDIEGSEADFLKGATELLKLHKPILVLSAHGYQKRDECIALLEEFLYTIEMVVSNKIDGDYVFIAKPAREG